MEIKLSEAEVEVPIEQGDLFSNELGEFYLYRTFKFHSNGMNLERHRLIPFNSKQNVDYVGNMFDDLDSFEEHIREEGLKHYPKSKYRLLLERI